MKKVRKYLVLALIVLAAAVVLLNCEMNLSMTIDVLLDIDWSSGVEFMMPINITANIILLKRKG